MKPIIAFALALTVVAAHLACSGASAQPTPEVPVLKATQMPTDTPHPTRTPITTTSRPPWVEKLLKRREGKRQEVRGESGRWLMLRSVAKYDGYVMSAVVVNDAHTAGCDEGPCELQQYTCLTYWFEAESGSGYELQTVPRVNLRFKDSVTPDGSALNKDGELVKTVTATTSVDGQTQSLTWALVKPGDIRLRLRDKDAVTLVNSIRDRDAEVIAISVDGNQGSSVTRPTAGLGEAIDKSGQQCWDATMVAQEREPKRFGNWQQDIAFESQTEHFWKSQGNPNPSIRAATILPASDAPKDLRNSAVTLACENGIPHSYVKTYLPVTEATIWNAGVKTLTNGEVDVGKPAYVSQNSESYGNLVSIYGGENPAKVFKQAEFNGDMVRSVVWPTLSDRSSRQLGVHNPSGTAEVLEYLGCLESLQ